MLFTSTSLKAMLFVSLALASNAALPPAAQQAREERRIRRSKHMKEMIGNNPKFGITKIERMPYHNEIADIDGYSLLNQYKVSARTHGEGCWMTEQGYIIRDFTVYSVRSKKALGMAGPINFGLLFMPECYVEDPAAGKSGVVNSSSSAKTTLTAALNKSSSAPPADCNGVKPPADCNGVKPLPPSDCNGVKPFPYVFPGVGPVIIDPKNKKDGQAKRMIRFNTNRNYQVLPRNTDVGYIAENVMSGTYRPQGFVGGDVLPFRSTDESIVTCKLVDVTPKGFFGVRNYQQQFIAKNWGSTTVTNGPVSFTIQVGLLNN